MRFRLVIAFFCDGELLSGQVTHRGKRQFRERLVGVERQPRHHGVVRYWGRHRRQHAGVVRPFLQRRRRDSQLERVAVGNLVGWHNSNTLAVSTGPPLSTRGRVDGRPPLVVRARSAGSTLRIGRAGMRGDTVVRVAVWRASFFVRVPLLQVERVADGWVGAQYHHVQLGTLEYRHFFATDNHTEPRAFDGNAVYRVTASAGSGFCVSSKCLLTRHVGKVSWQCGLLKHCR